MSLPELTAPDSRAGHRSATIADVVRPSSTAAAASAQVTASGYLMQDAGAGASQRM